MRVLGLRGICYVELEFDQIVETCDTSASRHGTAITRCAQQLTLLDSVESGIELVKIVDSIFHVVPKQLILVIGCDILLKLLKLFEGSNLEAEVLFLRIVNSLSIVIAKERSCYVPGCTKEKSARAFVLSEPSRAEPEICCWSRSLPNGPSCRSQYFASRSADYTSARISSIFLLRLRAVDRSPRPAKVSTVQKSVRKDSHCETFCK